MGILEDDVDALLADLALFGESVDVVYSGSTVKGYVDIGDGFETDEAGLSIELRGRSVVVKTGAIAPSVGDTITVGGVGYSIREISPVPRDGRMTRYALV